MFDSFGLDAADVRHFGAGNSNTPWYGHIWNGIKRAFAKDGFVAWWVLQHVKGYKHLDTKIYNNETFTGTIKH